MILAEIHDFEILPLLLVESDLAMLKAGQRNPEGREARHVT